MDPEAPTTIDCELDKAGNNSCATISNIPPAPQPTSRTFLISFIKIDLCYFNFFP